MQSNFTPEEMELLEAALMKAALPAIRQLFEWAEQSAGTNEAKEKLDHFP